MQPYIITLTTTSWDQFGLIEVSLKFPLLQGSLFGFSGPILPHAPFRKLFEHVFISKAHSKALITNTGILAVQLVVEHLITTIISIAVAQSVVDDPKSFKISREQIKAAAGDERLPLKFA